MADVRVGDQLEPHAVPIRRVDLVRYAGASGDANPIHWSDRAAVAAGLPGVIAHGMLTMGLVAGFVVRWCGDPVAVLDCSVVFTRPLLVPDDDDGVVLEIGGRVTGVDSDACTVTVALTAIAAGQKVLGRSVAVVSLA
ncbi:MAG: MaoC/PaaZ C-terminal domain-containing protein [Mycobacteriaceae bacterium]